MTVRPRAAAVALLSLGAVACAGIAPGRSVQVDGHAIRVRTAGRGEPTVVFDSGLGDPMGTWHEVWPTVARFTRVFLWDRAGLGDSEPGPDPRTSSTIVAELRAALDRAGIPGPYVLVGHSFGGLNARLFASRYPSDVAGLVLVDATHEDFPAIERRLRPVAEQERLRTTLSLGPRAAVAEFQSLDESASEVRRSPPPTNIPVVVLSAGRRGDPEALERAWSALQIDLASRFPRGRRIVVPGAGHYVQYDAPASVVAAIREVVEEARGEIRGQSAP